MISLSETESVQDFYLLFIYVLLLEIQVSRGEVLGIMWPMPVCEKRKDGGFLVKMYPFPSVIFTFRETLSECLIVWRHVFERRTNRCWTTIMGYWRTITFDLIISINNYIQKLTSRRTFTPSPQSMEQDVMNELTVSAWSSNLL